MFQLRLAILVVLFLACSADNEAEVEQRTDSTEGSAAKRAVVSEPSAAESQTLTHDDVVHARRRYTVAVVKFDASQKFGTSFPYSDYVRLRITNGSELTLKTLTVLVKRFDNNGKMVGSSRAPAIPTGDIQPGETVEVDYYPRGHMGGVGNITVEVEDTIDPEAEQFFPELRGLR